MTAQTSDISFITCVFRHRHCQVSKNES